jgi:hypothetical protein
MFEFIAQAVMGGIMGGGKSSGQQQVIREPERVKFTRYMRPTGRRSSSARRSTAAPVTTASPHIGSSQYTAQLRGMLRDQLSTKQATTPKA